MKKQFASAFSLIEVTLALGIAAFCLIAVFGLIPVAALTNRNATSQTRATNIMAAAIADLRATPSTSSVSLMFVIPINNNSPPTITRFFDSQGQCSCDITGLPKPFPATRTCAQTWTPALKPRYRLTITWSGSTTLRYADLKVTWPAELDPTITTPSGATELFAAFDRN